MTPEDRKLLEEAIAQSKKTEARLQEFLSIYYRTNFPDVMIIEKNLSVVGGATVRDTLTVRNKISLFGGAETGQLSAVTAPSGGGSSSSDAVDITGRAAINALIARLQSLNIIP